MQTVDVEKVAEAVLYEGYLLFPYRQSAMKNQQRWTFGGVYPRQYCEAMGGDDPWLMQTQCLVSGGPEAELAIKVRFLHVADRKILEYGEGFASFVNALRIGGHVYRPWEEAMERSLSLGAESGEPPLRLAGLVREPRQFSIAVPAGSQVEKLIGEDGRETGAIVREWQSLEGTVEVSAEPVALESDRSAHRSDAALYRLTVQIRNTASWPGEGEEYTSRVGAVRRSFISTHTILRVLGGEFVSLLEPPDGFEAAAAACANIKTWPVIAGEPGERHTILSSPIILYDYPRISPESQGNYFDATEIDELLALSVMTLTDEEKQEMRESDHHGREILERTETLSEEQLMKMHGVVRYLHPSKRDAE